MSIRNLSLSIAAALLALAASGGSSARAAFIVTMQQVGSNVVATGSGSINTASLTDVSGASVAGRVWPDFPVGSYLQLGSPSATGISGQLYTSISGPSTFGTGGETYATSGSGDLVGVTANYGLFLPLMYPSGAALSDTDTWSGATLSGLGVTPGNYTWNWGTGPTADSFTLDVVAPVPEPASLGLLGIGALALLGRRRHGSC